MRHGWEAERVFEWDEWGWCDGGAMQLSPSSSLSTSWVRVAIVRWVRGEGGEEKKQRLQQHTFVPSRGKLVDTLAADAEER